MTDRDIVQRPLDPGALVALKDRAARVLDEARRAGASDAEVGISASQGLSVSVRMDEVETLEFHRDRGISVTVYIGQQKGSASSSDDSDDSIRAMVAAACAIARHTGADPCAGLAEGDQLATRFPDLDLYHPWSLTPEQAIEQALACERAGRTDPRIVNSEGASLSSGSSLRVYANSKGFMAGYPSSHHSRSCVLVAEQDGAMQRDYWYDSRRDPAHLQSAEAIGAEACRRTLARLGAERPATADMPVLFSPRTAASLLGHFVAAISGGSLYRNASFLKDTIGETLFPSWVRLHERPHLPGMTGSAAWDQDGLPTRDQDFVRDGVLQQYALGLYASRRLVLAPTGNGGGVRNLAISNSGDDLDALLRKVGHGILITELMGPGVNIVSGDYSRGASGFLIENGRISVPLEEFTIAGHLRDIFAAIDGSGTDVDDRGNIHCGSLLIRQMRVAGR
ncbi:MAG: metalloprotease PmbA [Alcanivoracaceae bacterium]